MIRKRWFQIFMIVAFIVVLAFNAYGGVRDLQFQRYIKETVQRDAAQDECLIDLGAWLQEWLDWRWNINIDATKEQIIEYQRLHPRPICKIESSIK